MSKTPSRPHGQGSWLDRLGLVVIVLVGTGVVIGLMQMGESTDCTKRGCDHPYMASGLLVAAWSLMMGVLFVVGAAAIRRLDALSVDQHRLSRD